MRLSVAIILLLIPTTASAGVDFAMRAKPKYSIKYANPSVDHYNDPVLDIILDAIRINIDAINEVYNQDPRIIPEDEYKALIGRAESIKGTYERTSVLYQGEDVKLTDKQKQILKRFFSDWSRELTYTVDLLSEMRKGRIWTDRLNAARHEITTRLYNNIMEPVGAVVYSGSEPIMCRERK